MSAVGADARPLLLIDVDGVLRREGPGVAEGFEVFYREGREVQLNPAHGAALLAFADRFDLVWATGWHGEANEFVAPLVGLPRLPVVSLAPAVAKSGGIDAFAGDRPVCWLDDDVLPEDRAWARARVARGVPTLIVVVDYRSGLTEAHLREVARFALSLGLRPSR